MYRKTISYCVIPGEWPRTAAKTNAIGGAHIRLLFRLYCASHTSSYLSNTYLIERA